MAGVLLVAFSKLLNFGIPNVTDIIQQSKSKVYKNPSDREKQKKGNITFPASGAMPQSLVSIVSRGGCSSGGCSMWCSMSACSSVGDACRSRAGDGAAVLSS